METKAHKIIVLDDDPTGSQTVHSCPLLLRWDVASLVQGLGDHSPYLFILSNSRSLDGTAAAARNREIAENLVSALEQAGNPPYLLVSRSDSTLRGHFPVETDVLTEVLGPFDQTFLVPAFFEGGRITRGGVHYLQGADGLVRTDQTPFAADSVFGYRSSYLPDYVEEKTGGRVRARDVSILPRGQRAQDLASLIAALPAGGYCAVDAEGYSDLDAFAEAVQELTASGRRYLFRSAAGLLKSLGQPGPQPLPPGQFGSLVRGRAPGVVICGSHVPLSTRQLGILLEEPGVVGIELDVGRVGDGGESTPAATTAAVIERVAAAISDGQTPVVYTSRTEVVPADKAERLRLGERVSSVLVDIVRSLPSEVGFLISKGGITSHDVLARGLELSTCRVFGQIAAGCTVVLAPEGTVRHGLPVVVFPGNVGEPETLRDVFRILDGKRHAD